MEGRQRTSESVSIRLAPECSALPSKVTCRQRMHAAGHAVQSAKAERRLINAEIKADQKLNVRRRRRSKMAASELGQPLV